MKKYLMLSALALMLALAPVAYADDDRPGRPRFELPKIPKIMKQVASTTASTTRRDDRDEDRRASTTRNVRSEPRSDNGLHLGIVMRVKGEVARYITLLEAHIKRLENLIDRLTTRANELDAEGIATSDGRAHLASSTAELGLAQSDLNALKADAAANATLNASTTPQVLKDRYQKARTLMKSAREHIRKAYSELKAAVKSFKAAAKDHREDDD